MLCEGTIVVPQGERDRSIESMFIALAMAAYEMSAPLDPEDPEELFPSKGFLLPQEIRPYITYRDCGPQLVMDVAFERLIMLDVRPARYYDPENGAEGAFVINAQKFGNDPRQGRTPALLVERANGIIPDVIDGFSRLRILLEKAFGPEERNVTVSPAVPADGSDIDIDIEDPDEPAVIELTSADIIESVDLIEGEILDGDEVWAVPDDHELDAATENFVAEGAMLFANVNVRWELGDDDVIEPIEEVVGSDDHT